MPSAGKSHFGALLAKQLDRVFIDTDLLIIQEYFNQTHSRVTCRQIVLQEGDLFFRLLENKVIQGLENIRNAVIAVGGGAICHFENRRILKGLGWVIYLRVSSSSLLDRIVSKNSIPSYLDQDDLQGSFEILLKKRIPLYEEMADYCLDVDRENILEVLSRYAEKEKTDGK